MTSVNDIRLLSADEIPLLLPIVRAFYAEGVLPGKLNESHFVTVLKNQVENNTGFVLAGGLPIRGAISGIIFKDAATAEDCCMEHFWYVLVSERGSIGLRLLDAWEKEAKQRGINRVIMAHLHAPNTEKFTKMYERRGYKLLEQIFMKEIDQCA